MALECRPVDCLAYADSPNYCPHDLGPATRPVLPTTLPAPLLSRGSMTAVAQWRTLSTHTSMRILLIRPAGCSPVLIFAACLHPAWASSPISDYPLTMGKAGLWGHCGRG